MLVKSEERIDHCDLLSMFTCLISAEGFRPHHQCEILNWKTLALFSLCMDSSSAHSFRTGRHQRSSRSFPYDYQHGLHFKLNLAWDVWEWGVEIPRVRREGSISPVDSKETLL